MTPLLAGALAAALHVLAPPPALNIVHHHLKRGAAPAYQPLEASIVAAYERAKVPLYWLTFQSTKDPREILYLNVFDSADGLAQASATYRAMAPAHPELARLSGRLASLVETQTSLLTTRRDEVPYTRADVDFSTMRALRLVTFRVRAGHEGQFMDAVRKASGGGAPWIVYEANAESTFVLLSPLRSRTEAAHGAAIPRALRELRRSYRRVDVEVYALSAPMSRTPAQFLAKSKNIPGKPKAH